MNEALVGHGDVWVTEYGKRLADEQAIAVLNRRSGAHESSKAGRPLHWTQERLSGVARVYGAAWEAGDHPTIAVAVCYQTSRSMAAKLVAMARGAGLLPATRQGKGGAQSAPNPTSPVRR